MCFDLVHNCVFIVLWSTKMPWTICLAVSKLLQFKVSWKKLNSSFSLSTPSRGFTDLLSNCSKRLPGFLSGYIGTENMFYFLHIFLFTYIFIQLHIRKSKHTTICTKKKRMVLSYSKLAYIILWFLLVKI
mgnify:CR=1 FL=1